MKNYAIPIALLTAALLCPALAARADDYAQTGAIGFPITALPGNPVLQTTDRLTGFVAAGQSLFTQDFPTQYITLQGSGQTGLHLTRYTFTADTGGFNALALLFDTHSFDPAIDGIGKDFGFTGVQPFTLGYSYGQFFADSKPRILFDQFESDGSNQTFGVGFTRYEGNTLSQDYSYSLSWERTETPVSDLGALLPGDDFSALGTFAIGAGDWYSFTLNSRSDVRFDTLGSAFDTGMALFDANGHTIDYNDDGSPDDYTSAALHRWLDPGTYYVTTGIPYSFANWKDAPYFDPSGGPKGWSRDGFSGGGYSTNAYQLNIHVAAAPEPGSLAFAALAAGGVLGLIARKKRG